MKNAFLNTFLIAFLALFLFGGCEKEVAFSSDDGMEFCPANFRMTDNISSSLTCPNGQLAPAVDQICQTASDGQGIVFSKSLYKDSKTAFFWNENLDQNLANVAQHWVDSKTAAGGFLKFEKIELDTGARFSLFFGPVTFDGNISRTAPDFGEADASKFEVFVAREADGKYSITARGGGKEQTIGGVSDFSNGYFRLFHNQPNGRMLLWVWIEDGAGNELAKIEINDASFNFIGITPDQRLGFGFGMELLPDFKDDCAARLCRFRLKNYMFGAVYANVSDDFPCNSIIRN